MMCYDLNVESLACNMCRNGRRPVLPYHPTAWAHLQASTPKASPAAMPWLPMHCDIPCRHPHDVLMMS